MLKVCVCVSCHSASKHSTNRRSSSLFFCTVAVWQLKKEGVRQWKRKNKEKPNDFQILNVFNYIRYNNNWNASSYSSQIEMGMVLERRIFLLFFFPCWPTKELEWIPVVFVYGVKRKNKEMEKSKKGTRIKRQKRDNRNFLTKLELFSFFVIFWRNFEFFFEFSNKLRIDNSLERKGWNQGDCC